MPRGNGKNKEVDDTKSKRNRADIAKWPAPSEKFFIEICYEQFLQGQLLSPSFSNYVWAEICDRLNQAVAPFYTYTPLQLQGKWNRCKLVWKVFHGWMTTHTGLGWDPERNTVTGPDDVLASLASSLKDGDRIIEAGLQCYDMCTEMFRTTVATGSMARSSTQFALEDEEEDTGTRGSSSRSRVRGRSFSEDVSMGCNSGGTSTGCAPISGEDVLGSKKRRPTVKQNAKQTRFFQALDEWKEMQDAKFIRVGPAAQQSCDDCVEALDNLVGIPSTQYVKAMNAFVSATKRHLFLKMKDDEKRKIWVESLP